MKWAWLCLLWSFAVSVIVISPYLEFHERDSKLRLLEEQGPHLYFDSLKLEDQGRLTTNEFHLTCVIRNRSDKPAQDCEMLFILIKKRDDGTFNLIPFAKSASGLIQPQGWLSASIIVGTELSTDSTRLSTNSPELPSDDLVIMEACKYLNPITRSQYTTPPFFNKFKIIQSSRTLDDLGALTIEESKRYFGAISNKYEEFRNPKPASSK